MRVLMQTWGTEGDVRPFLALGSELSRRGHRVRLLYTNIEARDFSDLARECGVEATAVAQAYFDERREYLEERARASFKRLSPLKQLNDILEDVFDPVAEAMFDAGCEAAKDADIFVSHFVAYSSHVAAEASARPHVMVGLVPMMPSKEFPPIGLPGFGPITNRVAWWLGNKVFESIFGTRIKRLRERANLSRIDRVLDLELERTRLALCALSPALFPRPTDWPDRVHLTGFLRLPAHSESWQPDASLRAFLDAGPPPAFLSFGSMFNLDPERTARHVALLGEAVEKAGQRGIIQAPRAVISQAPARPNVFYLERAPHEKLFPKCSVIVHHGGAGTTQSALLAGRPSIVVPHAADQFYWAQVLQERGLAARPIKATSLSVDAMASRLGDVASHPEWTTRAVEIGAKIASENGAATASDEIERAFDGGV